MTKRTLIGVGLLGGLLVLAGIVASTRPINMPMPAKPQKTSSLPILAKAMPPFTGITKWWNTSDGKPLTPEELKGKVVLVDFWTYSCINCIRTYPYLRALHSAYADKGLVIVGVHTPEFAFEAVPENVEREVKKNQLAYPIALDAAFGTWNAYSNHYWPAEYFFDCQGRLRRTHFGEGEYTENEQAIRDLLEECRAESLGAPTNAGTMPDFSKIHTSETYFGYNRTENFANSDQLKTDQEAVYSMRIPSTNEWSVFGTWRMEGEKAVATKPGAGLRFSVDANAFHLVLGSADGKPKRVLVQILRPENTNITEDMRTPDLHEDPEASVDAITVTDQKLYRILRFPNGGRYIIDLQPDPGVEFYAATFGE